MAWVRPKNPKPKVVDRTESTKRLLEYFSGRPTRPNPKIDHPRIRDPTLQRFAQNQIQAAAAASRPQPPKRRPESPPSLHPPHQHEEPPVIVVVDRDRSIDRDHGFEEYADNRPTRPRRRKVPEYDEYDFAPEAPPKPVVRSRPPPKAMRHRVDRDRGSRDRTSWETRSARSSRWASAITPLPELT